MCLVGHVACERDVGHVRSPTCALLRDNARRQRDNASMPVAHVKAGRHVGAALRAGLGGGLHVVAVGARLAVGAGLQAATRSSTSCYPIHKQIDKLNCVLTNKIAKPNLTNSLERHVELRATCES